jgi:hypothetical protein
VPRQVAQLTLKAVKAIAAAANATAAHSTAAPAAESGGERLTDEDDADGERKPSSSCSRDLEEELLRTAESLLALAASAPPAAAPDAATASAPLYVQTHALARSALLCVRGCLASRPAVAARFVDLVACAVRLPSGKPPQLLQSPARCDEQGWLLPKLQHLIKLGCTAHEDGSSKGADGPGQSSACRSPTPARTPVLLAATPPPTGGAAAGTTRVDDGGEPGVSRRQHLRLPTTPPASPNPAGIGNGGVGGGAASTPQSAARTLPGGAFGGCNGVMVTPLRAAAAAGGDGGAAFARAQVQQHAQQAVSLAVSGAEAWALVAQLLGPRLLRDKAVGQAMLNVSRCHAPHANWGLLARHVPRGRAGVRREACALRMYPPPRVPLHGTTALQASLMASAPPRPAPLPSHPDHRLCL